MKITGSPLGKGMQGIESAKSRGLEKSQDTKGNAESAEVFEGDSSKINLSSRAQQMQKAKDIAMAAPDVNEARVAELQRLIDSGKYKVDAAAVADRLVDDHLMFPE